MEEILEKKLNSMFWHKIFAQFMLMVLNIFEKMYGKSTRTKSSWEAFANHSLKNARVDLKNPWEKSNWTIFIKNCL